MATQVASPIDGKKLGDIKPIGVMTPEGFTPIPDAEKNPHIIDLAGWAVDQYNKEHGTSLKFKKVYYAFRQVIYGADDIMYSIILEADYRARKGVYAATVRERFRMLPERELVAFVKIFPPA
ncbi:hypothetical protein BUALT_Bualt12G0028200 [Buddleja alternifolia]|uniref:Cysteine proteinase inhibitor n=1 Tax=Buddleja alternifolia TaxID=168488 RepID=A0AAV6WPP6_9LAMI|nr:hypothetical protein BUALT_Bualt12G0028200 [Buddleja alternifolia]